MLKNCFSYLSLYRNWATPLAVEIPDLIMFMYLLGALLEFQ
jgi:hypothetical protein